jgi:dienelactone hydrolase
MKLKNVVLLFFSFIFISSQALAKIKTETVEYKDGDTTLEGYIAYDTAKISKPHPAIIVVHDWMGISDDTKNRAEQIAKMGFVGFAADIYGKGQRAQNADDAKKLSSQFKTDRKLMRSRATAALDKLTSYKFVDKNKIAAIGFCFGGTTVLELARSGAPLVGTVTFHGGLDTPHPEDAKNIKGKVLVLHGGDDPFVKTDDVVAFQDEMRKAKVDWQFVAFGNSVHAFTVRGAGSDPSKGVAYNPLSEKRAWLYFQDFLKEVF